MSNPRDTDSESLSPRVGIAFYGTRESLRPAQREAMIPILAGRDTLILAATGSGKTEAAIAPVVDRWRDNCSPGVTTWVYITPTRALANDLLGRLVSPIAALGLSVGAQHAERKALSAQEPPDLLITTPESLDIAVTRMHEALRGVRAIIVDEVHQFADSQRGLQLAMVIHRLERMLDRDLQVVGMSATVSNPDAVWAALRPDGSPSIVEDPTPRPRTFRLHHVDSNASLTQALKRLDGTNKVLVFTRSRASADKLADLLRDGDNGFGDRIYVHHSSIDKKSRELIEERMRQRERAICFATTTLELGIDIGDVDLVVLAEPASDWMGFLQRIGRGSRRTSGPTETLLLAGASIQSAALDAAMQLAMVHLVSSPDVLAEEPPLRLAAIAQQVCHEVSGTHGWIDLDPMIDDFATASGRPQADVAAIVHALIDQEVLRRHPMRRAVGRGAGLEEIEDRRETWGNFPTSSATVPIRHDGRTLGTVPSANLALVAVGDCFVHQGRRWTVASTGEHGINVLPTAEKPNTQLKYSSPPPLADAKAIDAIHDVWGGGYDHLLYPGTLNWWQGARNTVGPIDRSTIRIQRSGSTYTSLTLAGRLVNEVILSSLKLQGTASDTAITTSARPRFHDLPTDTKGLTRLAVGFLAGRTSSLSVWQKRIPSNLLYQELASEWTRKQAHGQVLARLARAELVELTNHNFDCLLANP